MPRPFSWIARASLACALAASVAVVATPRPSEAQRTPVTSITIRDVSSSQDPALAAPLRSAVQEALASIDVVGEGGAPGFLLDVSVTRLTSHVMPVGNRVDCEVSIVVEDAERGVVRGVLTGRAHVIGEGNLALAQTAMRAAARGALRSLPTAIAAR